MNKTPLAEAVNHLAISTCGFTDQDLEKPWSWGSYDEEGVRFAFFRTYEELRQLAAVLKTLRANSNSPITEAQMILAGYQAAYQDLQSVLVGVSDEKGDASPAGEWSQRHTLSHIIKAAQGFFYVIQHAVGSTRATQSGQIDLTDDAWNAFWRFDPSSQDDGGHSLSALLDYYHTLNIRVLNEFCSITEEELRAPSRYWEAETMTIRFRLHRMDSHLRQHTIQIEKIQTLLGMLPSETRRLLRLIYNALADVQGAMIGAQAIAVKDRQELASRILERSTEITSITP